MKPTVKLFLLSAVATFAVSLPAFCQPAKVIIVRHGEKPPQGDNLSCQGLNRALALPPVLYKACGGAPAHTYVPAMKTGKSTSSVRMFQTVTPFAVKYNLKINSKYAETDTVKAAADVLTKNGVVLMVWEHGNIPGLARNLGVTGEDLTWKGSDFDSMWVITFTKDGSGTLQATLSKQQEGLNPSPVCK